MPTAIPPAKRREIVRLCLSGKSAAEVSRQLELGYPGVAKIWRLYRRHGASALETSYSRCGRKAIYQEAIREEINQALASNPQLGAPIIRARLLASGRFDKVPHERTIQRWWRASGKNKARGRGPKIERAYAREPHRVWQIDGKENVELASGKRVCYLSFTDESTCTFLSGQVFSLSPPDATGEC